MALRTLRLTDEVPQFDVHRVIRAHQDQAPVRVNALARDLGLAIFASDLRDGISGKIVNEGGRSESGYIVYVNRNEAVVRQRFTAAHEIAHFILHRDRIGDGITDDVLYRSKLSSPMEAEANRLAADILMPWHLIREVTAGGVTDVRNLAEHFEVSEIAMSIRLGLPT
jgi:Zn-dependent peptidase ImmA (M78 family)